QGDWIEATRGDVVSGVDVSGTLSAVDSSMLGPPQIPDVWEFKVAMLAPEGSDVKKGTPVLGFDTADLHRRLDQYRALAEQAATAEIRLLESKHAQAAAVVHDSEAAIKAMMVTAPRDGTVVYTMDWKGDKRKVGDSCWRGQRVVEIPDLNKMKAKGEVDEV